MLLKQLFLSGLVASQLGWFSVVQAQVVFERPQCDPSEITSGLCFSRNMPEAVRVQTSSAFQQAFDSVVATAQARLDSTVPDRRKVVLTDLDETLVSNLGYYQSHIKPSTPEWRQWVSRRVNGPYNRKVLELLKNAQAKGFSIMFITGRPPTVASETLRQVCGLQWDGAFFRPNNSAIGSTAFKTATRQMLRDLGYEIVVNIGDQPSDMDLPVSVEEGDFLLPNVLYNIP